MTMNGKTILRALAVGVLFLTISSVPAVAGINNGFFKKAAEKVWSLGNDSVFNPATPVSDSIACGQSAVIIARQDHFETKREEQNTIYDATGRTNRAIVRHIRRSMVRLLDQSAVDYYSDFEFGGTTVRRDYGNVIDVMVENAFGARIHKSDGRIVTIDPSTALEVSDGKKGGKNKMFKIAIPSLETGDVIEYFYYTEYMKERGGVCGLNIELSDRYPVLTRLVTGRLDRDLTAEFYSYNGAPKVFGTVEKDCINAWMRCDNVPAVSFSKFLFPERQLPFVRLNVLNNYVLPDEQTFQATTTRSGGIYNSISSGPIINEAKEYIAHMDALLWKYTRQISPLPSRALKMARNFVKSHPTASPREIADAAYLALRYCNLTADDDDKIGSSFLLSMFLKDVLERLEIFPLEATGIGLVNSREEVPTAELSGWDQSNFVACAGDSVYLMFPGLNIAPGEFPGEFQGEQGFWFNGRLREMTKVSPVNNFTVPDRKYAGNYVKTELKVSLADDDPAALHVSRDVRLSGSGKRFGEDLVDRAEWIAGVEKYFGIDNNPYRIKGYDVKERDDELREALMDECADVTGVRPDSVMKYEILERGFLPGRDEMHYTTTARFSGLVDNLGDDISVTLGRLAGYVEKLEGSERERLLDAMLPTAFQNTHLITFKVPQGYKVDTTSLDEFNRIASNSLGIFMANAKVNDNGDVVIQCVLRVKKADVPLNAWPLMRDLYDVGSRFADAAIVFVKA